MRLLAVPFANIPWLLWDATARLVRALVAFTRTWHARAGWIATIAGELRLDAGLLVDERRHARRARTRKA